VAHGTRYWRSLIGPWLLHALHGAYDRYVRLRDALTADPALRTIVLDSQSFRVPSDTSEFMAMLFDDPYNLQMISQQFQHMGFAFPHRTFDGPWQIAGEPSKPSRWQQARARGLDLVEQGIGRLQVRRRGAVLIGMSCARSSLWALAWRSRLKAIPQTVTWDVSRLTHAPLFDARRNDLATLPASDEFERLFIRSLPFTLPTLYLEGYQWAREAVRRQAQRMPTVILSASGWAHQEPFKFVAAEASERGSRLVVVQHGGGYGLYRHSPMERHERVVADTFLAWGWANGASGESLANIPHPRLSTLVMARDARQSPSTSAALLFVSTAHLRYLLRFHSCPIGVHTPAYLQWQLRFLTELPDRLRRLLRFRTYPQEFGYAIQEQITNRVGPLQWDGRRPFAQTLDDARIVVIDHSGTTFLETLRHGVPTVLFWDPRLSEVRDEAAPYVEALRATGMLWDSPEAAAAHVAAVYDDPGEWWNRSSVQEARQRFIEHYALGRRDWLRCWTKAVDDELAASRLNGAGVKARADGS
jgi:putative transferase (TIGR04331 family)